MRRLPDSLLEEHHCAVVLRATRTRPEEKELGYQQALRLQQALWREARGYPVGGSRARPQGAWLELDWARESMANFVTEAAARCAGAALSEKEQSGALIDEPRLMQNLVSSQPLAFNLFGPLKESLDMASVILSRLMGREVQVRRVEFEYSPGRGDRRFTGDRSASDVHIEYETREGKRGLLGIEVKLQENLTPRNPKRRDERRYVELAMEMGCFRPECAAALRDPTVEQLWRDHMLVGSQLLHTPFGFDEGYFVLLYPTLNESCRETEEAYRMMLTDESSFLTWTLEELVDALASEVNQSWVDELRDRYLSFKRVDKALQRSSLHRTTEWAARSRRVLGPVLESERGRVHFRPTTSGVTMVGLLPDKCDLGRSYGNLERLAWDFHTEFPRYCDAEGPARPTSEKELQGFLIRDALSKGRSMVAINEASRRTADPVELTFVTDELVLPTVRRDHRMDILAIRPTGGVRAVPVVIELKTVRARKELIRQTKAYGAIVGTNAESMSKLITAILGREVILEPNPELWIVWPQAGPKRDPREADFAGAGVRVVGYRNSNTRYEFRVGAPVRPGSRP